MFPIRDESSRVIAFGGREMPGAESPPKYLNSPETPLFSKSRCLFGIDLARQKMVESRTAVVVEGYTDVIVAHQFGASNVVSPLGTALTEQHVGILRRFADRIVLLFDADAAGDNAVDRAVGLFLTQPVEIAIASMPDGLDPDEFLLQNGTEAFTKILDDASDALSYKWRQLIRQFNASGGDLTGQQKAVSAYLEVLASARGGGPVDAIRWGSALARVSRLTDIPVDELNRRFRVRKPARPMSSAAPVAVATEETPVAAVEESEPQGPLNARDRAELWILGILLLEPHRWHQVQRSIHVEDFARKRHRALAEMYWNYQRDEGEPVFNEFLGAIQEPALAEIAVHAVEEIEVLTDIDQVLAEALAYFDHLRRVNEEQKLVAASRRTNSSDSALDEIALLKELTESRKRPDLHRA
jgi:DNA primase